MQPFSTKTNLNPCQAGGRIHGVFLLGREERVFNLGTVHERLTDCCTTLPRRPPPVGVDRKDASSPTTFRLGTFWRATSATTETPSHRHSMAIRSQWRRQGGKRSHATHNRLQAQDSLLPPLFPTHHSLDVVCSAAAAYYLAYTAVCLN